MKLSRKALILFSITCLSFLVLTFFNTVRSSLIYFIPLVILFSVIPFYCIQFFAIKRIEVLIKKLKQAKNAKYNSLHIQAKGNDEIAALTLEINELLQNKATSLPNLKNLKTQLPNKNKELNKERAELQKMEAINLETLIPDKKENLIITHKDPLTNLPNRTVFNDTLIKTISHSKRRNKIFAILIVDIDAFKEINNKLGRDFGDYVLSEISNRLTKVLRSEDIVARLNGDEFIILLNDIGKPKFASVVAEKIIQACAQPIEDFFHTVSVGVSVYPNNGESLEELLNTADAALFKAKHFGGNQYQFYTHEMNVEAREFVRFETALKQSIKNNELILYYQPKLTIKKGSITGIEALLRWAHPELGILSASQFIPTAEEIGFITQISEWALREACSTNKQWQNEGYEHLTVSLNLSPKQFQDPDTAKKISTILEETELNPQYLELEINEATVMDNIETAAHQLEAIKATGVGLSIDHFGAGYTSISHLKRFPINAIKIDQNYIKGVPNNPNDSAITNAFIALAHNLGLEVVAEGVETAEQVQYLSAQNCDMIQGYFLSHPLPAQKIVLQFKKLLDRALF